MSFVFDFGFEKKGASWNDAYLALLFASAATGTDMGRAPGPAAVADASRFVELFEMQEGVSPLDVGTYAEVVGGDDPLDMAAQRFVDAKSRGIFPVVIGDDRNITPRVCNAPLVALWGKAGRQEADENAVLGGQRTVLAGVRAASSNAFKSIPGNVTILTARGISVSREMFGQPIEKLEEAVHLSIDIDVLAPGVIQNPRSVEPGGLTWYELMELIELTFDGPGVASAELIGVGTVSPRTPASLVCAQILIKLAGLMAVRLK